LDKEGMPLADVPVIANNGGGSGVTDPNGYYKIIVPYGWSGTITPDISLWPEWTVTPKNYTNVISDQTDQNYSLRQPELNLFFREDNGNYVNGVEITVTGFVESIIVDGFHCLKV